jgi:hypothetical protein
LRIRPQREGVVELGGGPGALHFRAFGFSEPDAPIREVAGIVFILCFGI